MFRMEYVSGSQEETYKLGMMLGERLQGGEVVELNGELGAGKTTFTKGVAKALGVEDVITSPTFTLLNSYEGRLTLYHFDMYRLEKGEDVSRGFDEYYGQEGAVCLSEWSAAESYFGAKVIKVDFTYLDANKRRIVIE